MLPPDVPACPAVVPFWNWVTLTPRLKPVSCEPLPNKYEPLILAALIILPVAVIRPAVLTLPATTLAVALTVAPCTKAAVIILPPVLKFMFHQQLLLLLLYQHQVCAVVLN